jgi:hypothetical protein
MAEVTEESVKEFIERMNECGTRISEGRIAVDLAALCRLVSKNRDSASQVIELFCIMAESNPAYFQGALSIASAYQIEFNDSSFAKMVREKTKAAGAEEWLERIGILE